MIYWHQLTSATWNRYQQHNLIFHYSMQFLREGKHSCLVRHICEGEWTQYQCCCERVVELHPLFRQMRGEATLPAGWGMSYFFSSLLILSRLPLFAHHIPCFDSFFSSRNKIVYRYIDLFFPSCLPACMCVCVCVCVCVRACVFMLPTKQLWCL